MIWNFKNNDQIHKAQNYRNISFFIKKIFFDGLFLVWSLPNYNKMWCKVARVKFVAFNRVNIDLVFESIGLYEWIFLVRSWVF